jgi:alanine racemase
MVRPGIALYGCYPSEHVGRDLDLRPVLALKSVVARVHTLAAGETVSYGRTWTAPRASRIALIPCGYADGLPRIVSNRGSVLVRGGRAPIVGRVCMDQHMVDVTDIPGAAAGDEAVILGRQGDAAITAEEIAGLAGTINYEVLCAVAARVPRHYLRGGRVATRTSLLDPLGSE